jgi:hypothetical protein
MRILPSSSLLGSQTLVVDAQGDGDYTSIQAALNLAAGYATAQSRWSVRVAPGTYTGQLCLKDYVDLVGLAPGRAAHLKSLSGPLIAEPATCVLANLWLETVDTSVLALETSFSGVLELENVLIDQCALDVPPLQVAGGLLKVRLSQVMSGGALELSGGRLEMTDSLLRNQALEDGGQNMVLYIHGGTLLLSHCLVENVSPAGYGVYIHTSAGSLKAYHSILRKATATYAVHAAVSQPFTLAACLGNGPLHPNLTGYQDYVYDASI